MYVKQVKQIKIINKNYLGIGINIGIFVKLVLDILVYLHFLNISLLNQFKILI